MTKREKLKKILHRRKKEQQTINKFKRKRFSYNKFVKDFYVENNNAYISVNVKGLYDIISKFSINGYGWLDDDLAYFIETNAYYIPVQYNIILEICGHKFNNQEQEIITKTVKDYFGLKLGDKELDLKSNFKKSMILLLSSLAALCTLLILDNYIKDTLLEPAIIVFWVFMWDFIEVFFFDRSELKTKKLWAAQLASLKVIFNEEGNYEITNTEKTDIINDKQVQIYRDSGENNIFKELSGKINRD